MEKLSFCVRLPKKKEQFIKIISAERVTFTQNPFNQSTGIRIAVLLIKSQVAKGFERSSTCHTINIIITDNTNTHTHSARLWCMDMVSGEAAADDCGGPCVSKQHFGGRNWTAARVEAFCFQRKNGRKGENSARHIWATDEIAWKREKGGNSRTFRFSMLERLTRPATRAGMRLNWFEIEEILGYVLDLNDIVNINTRKLMLPVPYILVPFTRARVVVKLCGRYAHPAATHAHMATSMTTNYAWRSLISRNSRGSIYYLLFRHLILTLGATGSLARI